MRQRVDQVVEVAEGVSAGDRIINNPNAALLEGDRVRVNSPEHGYEPLNTDAPVLPASKEPSQ